MGECFRDAMRWLHTWAGVVVGALLFAIFWMGTLSVFDKEIDRWMMPDTRLPPGASISLDRAAATARQAASAASRWRFMLPTARAPLLRLYYADAAGKPRFRDFHPASGRLLPDQGTLGGSRFIFPFHFSLHLKWRSIGYWLVGLAAMAMLVLLVSGVVIHRRIFKEFFTFRPARRLPRSTLDLHNLTGVAALPFHFVMTLSGLVIFVNIYFPQAPALAYPETGNPRAAFVEEAYGDFSRAAAGEPGRLSSVNAMIARAEAGWPGSHARSVEVFHPGDAASYVEVRRAHQDSITMNLDKVYFDAGSGEILHRSEAAPVLSAQRFVSGMHFIQFDHWPLRWLYFALGLSGCVMIATGFLYWLEVRRKRHAARGMPGVRIVAGLTVGSVTGIVAATFAFFVANRLLPLDAAFAGYERAALEVWTFCLAWLGAFAHAWLRPRNAWREQCRGIAGLALSAVALNAATTGDHLFSTLVERNWPVAGMDLMLLAAAALAVWAARRHATAAGEAARRRKKARA